MPGGVANRSGHGKRRTFGNGVRANKGMKLTKPGELRSFAAYPRCSPDKRRTVAYFGSVDERGSPESGEAAAGRIEVARRPGKRVFSSTASPATNSGCGQGWAVRRLSNWAKPD